MFFGFPNFLSRLPVCAGNVFCLVSFRCLLILLLRGCFFRDSFLFLLTYSLFVWLVSLPLTFVWGCCGRFLVVVGVVVATTSPAVVYCCCCSCYLWLRHSLLEFSYFLLLLSLLLLFLCCYYSRSLVLLLCVAVPFILVGLNVFCVAGVAASLHPPLLPVIVFLATRHVAGRVGCRFTPTRSSGWPGAVTFTVLRPHTCFLQYSRYYVRCVMRVASLCSEKITLSLKRVMYGILLDFKRVSRNFNKKILQCVVVSFMLNIIIMLWIFTRFSTCIIIPV